MIKSTSFQLNTVGNGQIVDITGELGHVLADFGLASGVFCAFVPGSTGALTTIEAEPGVMADLRECLERAAPRDIPYAHNARWGDGNGHSHVRAAIVGPSLSIPVIDSRFQLGTWQQPVFIDFDVKPRSRRIVCQMVGE